jgi:RimJ/RimL family protein N-acetyltransferase
MKLTKIQLKKIKKTDLPLFIKWWKDKELISLTSGVYEKSNAVLAGYFFNMIKPGPDKHYLIILDNKKPIGNLSLTHKNKKTFEGHIVIGEKKYQGKGFGREAIRLSLRIAFNKLGYRRAYLEVRPDNKRAIKTYKSLGFEGQGIKKYPKNKFQPVVLKMLLSKEKFNRDLKSTVEKQ